MPSHGRRIPCPIDEKCPKASQGGYSEKQPAGPTKETSAEGRCEAESGSKNMDALGVLNQWPASTLSGGIAHVRAGLPSTGHCPWDNLCPYPAANVLVAESKNQKNGLYDASMRHRSMKTIASSHLHTHRNICLKNTP